MRYLFLVATLWLLPLPVAAQETRTQKWVLHTGQILSIAMDLLDTKSTFDAYDACGADVKESSLLLAPHVQNRTAFRVVKGAGASAINGIAWKVHDERPKATGAILYGNAAVKFGAYLHNRGVANDCRRRGVRPQGIHVSVKLLQVRW